MAAVAEEDPSRPPWPSSPSPGWVSGVDRLTALPNGLPLTPSSVAAASSATTADRTSESAAAAAAVVLAASANAEMQRRSSGSGNCSFVANIDSCRTCFNMSSPKASTPAECCQECAAAGPGACWSASFYQGVCWFKPQGASPVVVPGVVSCWPTGHGPVPTPPPPQPAPPQTREVHGGCR
jgi:hypothetical protein